jgi:hypothetical protein
MNLHTEAVRNMTREILNSFAQHLPGVAFEINSEGFQRNSNCFQLVPLI